MVIYPKNEIYLAYNVNCRLDGSDYNVLVEAHTGEILFENLLSVSEVVAASGNDEFEVNQDFFVNKLDILSVSLYTMNDFTKNIHYHDLKGSSDHNDWPGEGIFKTTNIWTTGEVSALVSVNHVYDYYLETLHRKGFDNNNGEFHVSINLGEQNSYSSCAGNNIVFGQAGSSYNKAAQAGIDTVGHEFTHSVSAYETDLEWNYSNAPGAIYEAYSDIFGYFAEGDNDPDWQHGEDNHDSPIRVMSDPNSKGMPTGVNDTIYYYDFSDPEKTSDNGGVHTNNSVISYPCYQMWNNGISDKERLATLWYTSLTYGYDSDTEFDDVRVNVFSEDDKKIADLDLDDTVSYGPETTTLYNPISGDYTFYVYNFSGSPSITSSGATVKVFTGNNNEPAYTFSVPLTGNGCYWNVFTYNSRSRRVTPVNTVTSSPVIV